MNRMKRFLSLSLILLTLAAVTLIPAFAIKAPSKITTFMDGHDGGGVSIRVSGLKQGQKITNVKIKNGKKPSLHYSGVRSAGKTGSGSSATRNYDITFGLMDAGTSKVSYTIGKKTYTTTVVVKPYTNPLSKFTISGIQNGKNLGRIYRNTSIVWEDMPSKTVKAGKLSLQTVKGWTIKEVSVSCGNYDKTFKYSGNGKTNLSISLPFTLNQDKYGIISLAIYNTSLKWTGHLHLILQ